MGTFFSSHEYLSFVFALNENPATLVLLAEVIDVCISVLKSMDLVQSLGRKLL